MGMFDEILENVGEPYRGKGFEYGTHEVLIMEAEAKAKDTKKASGCAVIEVTVAGKEATDKSASCTLWFHTDKAAKMSVTKVLGLLVHKVSEEKKEKVRELGKKLFGSINDPIAARDIATKLINDRLIGAEGYLVAEPNGKYKTTNFGDLWHYPAAPQGEPEDDAQATAKATGGAVVSEEDADNVPDFNEDDL